MDKYIEADRKLAFLLYPGLVNIYPEKLGEVLEANRCNWSRDWAVCGPLMVKSRISVEYWDDRVDATWQGVHSKMELLCNHADRDAAVRYAIVLVVIAMLEGAQRAA